MIWTGIQYKIFISYAFAYGFSTAFCMCLRWGDNKSHLIIFFFFFIHVFNFKLFWFLVYEKLNEMQKEQSCVKKEQKLKYVGCVFFYQFFFMLFLVFVGFHFVLCHFFLLLFSYFILFYFLLLLLTVMFCNSHWFKVQQKKKKQLWFGLCPSVRK